MFDPLERCSPGGMIQTGASPSRTVEAFRGVLVEAAAAVVDAAPDAAVFLYGSVATGQAVPGRSDVDLLTFGLEPDDAQRIGGHLSRRYGPLCRAVEVGPGAADDLVGDGDEAYGNRVFLRHYCVRLAGPDSMVPSHDFPADVRAARGFNGDIERHRDRWRRAMADGDDPAVVAHRLARKTLLAVAGLVSVHDGTWTTDRSSAAARWSEIEPDQAAGMRRLSSWVDSAVEASRTDVGVALVSVDRIVARFADDIGLWS